MILQFTSCGPCNFKLFRLMKLSREAFQVAENREESGMRVPGAPKLILRKIDKGESLVSTNSLPDLGFP